MRTIHEIAGALCLVRRHVCIISIYILTLLSPRVYAQNPAHTQSRSDTRLHFQAAIDAAADKWHIAIVAESSPINQDAAANISADQPGDTAGKAVARIAEAFDYSVKRRDLVYILNKRFTSPEDLPDLTMKEASADLRELEIILQPVDPCFQSASPRDRMPTPLNYVLTHDQLIAINHGGVPVSFLRAEQREAAWRIGLSLQGGNAAWLTREDSYFVNGILAEDTALHWSAVFSSSMEFGYDSTVGTPPRRGLKPISHPDSIELYSDGGGVGRPKPGDSDTDINDPTAPDPDTAKEVVRQAVKDHTITLDDALALLNRSVKPAAKSSIDAEFTGKTVTLAGVGNAAPQRLAEALAELYGLQARHRTGGGILITRKAVPTMTGYLDINPAVLIAVPDTVRRYAEARIAPLRTGVSRSQFEKNKSLYDYGKIGQELSIIARKKVREVAEPLAAAAKEKQIHVSQLPAVTARAFAVSQSADAFITALKMCGHDFPQYILDFQHAALVGSFIELEGSVDLTIGLEWTDHTTGNTVRSDMLRTVQSRSPEGGESGKR